EDQHQEQRRQCGREARLDRHCEIGRDTKSEANRRPQKKPLALSLQQESNGAKPLRQRGGADVRFQCVCRHAISQGAQPRLPRPLTCPAAHATSGATLPQWLVEQKVLWLRPRHRLRRLSGLHLLQPDTCISAAPARRSSIGSTPKAATGNSSCASKTPIGSATTRPPLRQFSTG